MRSAAVENEPIRTSDPAAGAPDIKQCGDAGRYAHWGATTQDIMDTAVVLQLRDGRQEAHDVIYDACQRANETHISLQNALLCDPKITAQIDRATIERLTSPGNYLGLAPQMVDRVLASEPREG